MDIYDDYCNDESDTYTSINRGEAREKSETKFENKKQRKVAIKEERKIQISRMQKKIVKEAFQEEFIKRGQDVIDNDVGGSTCFGFRSIKIWSDWGQVWGLEVLASM